jgi:hypothetical protein
VSYIRRHACGRRDAAVSLGCESGGLSDQQRVAIIDRLAAEPTAGDLIQGSGGARKVRFAGRGKGKSGGYRVITFYAGRTMPVFLLALYGKGERATLSKAERNGLRVLLGVIVETYRKGVARRA